MQQAYTNVYVCNNIERKKGRKMNIFLYITLFLIGVVIGNFWKVAIYRIPQNINIMKKVVSYPDSNHDNHKAKISKMMQRLFYALSVGILFVVLATIMKIDENYLQLSSIIMYLFATVYLTILIIITGIDKEHIKIEKKVIMSGIILSIIYIIYLYTIEPSCIYFNTICLGIYLILLVLDTFFIRRYATNSYTLGILMLLNFILIFSKIEIFIYTIIMSIVDVLLYILILQKIQKKNGNKKIKFNEIPIGYFIGVSNIIIFFIVALLNNCYI